MNKNTNTNTNITTNTNVCNNCGKQGHMFHQCKLPITSYGIIAFRESSEGLKYLMIRRKDSFGYIDFIRGKYSPQNIIQLVKIFNEMSVTEKKRISELSFEKLWCEMWGVENIENNKYKNEGILSKKKFDLLKEGIPIDNKTINLSEIMLLSNTSWEETEWEFPKGRRNTNETDLECALREFEEETGINKFNVKIIENILPFEEVFLGSNYKSYKHKFFLVHIDNNEYDEININNYQESEVSKIEWKTLNNCLASIRPYNLEKMELITNINKVLEEYRLYS